VCCGAITNADQEPDYWQQKQEESVSGMWSGAGYPQDYVCLQ
jgi:hypothetical protein